MAGVTKGTLDSHIETFETELDAGDYTAARSALIKAEIHLQSLPNTEKVSWRGTLDRAWDMLLKQEEIEATARTARRVLLRRDRS
jgi:hypothetical protein